MLICYFQLYCQLHSTSLCLNSIINLKRLNVAILLLLYFGFADKVNPFSRENPTILREILAKFVFN